MIRVVGQHLPRRDRVPHLGPSRRGMSAYAIYRELSKVGSWSEESDKVRWLAARYYSGADSLETLETFSLDYVEGQWVRPLLTLEQVNTIIQLR
jgi:hypothetical protein